jgi:transcriptional regulator with XRE-family HTH domain
VSAVTETTLPDGASLGAALRAAREAAGLTVEDISADTRIRGTLIRDLESDRFESSGAPVYARGHVRAITHAIGVDATPYLALFTSQVGDLDDPYPVAVPAPAQVVPAARGPLAPREPLHVPTAARPERRGPNWVAAGSAAVGVLVILFAVGQLNKPSSSNAGDPGGSATNVSASPSARPPVAPKTLTAQRPAPTRADLRLRLLGGDSWVSVRNATRTLFEGVLRNGAIQDFNDPKQLRIVVGNAGAVNIVCSGKDLGPAGGSGKVLRFTCSASGIVAA